MMAQTPLSVQGNCSYYLSPWWETACFRCSMNSPLAFPAVLSISCRIFASPPSPAVTHTTTGGENSSLTKDLNMKKSKPQNMPSV